jgi:acetyltransferase-like isoleucine patch superfamily enzyme
MNRFWHIEKSVLLDFKIGDDCTIHAPVWIGNNVLIGNRVKIQAFAFIPEGVTLEDDVFIGPHVTFLNDKLPPSTTWEPTFVRAGASIGGGSTILPGVTIGEYALIGAGSVVTKDVPAKEMWAGNPASLLRKSDYRVEQLARNFRT